MDRHPAAVGRLAGRRWGAGSISPLAQPPVAANHTPTPLGPVTNTIGAMQG